MFTDASVFKSLKENISMFYDISNTNENYKIEKISFELFVFYLFLVFAFILSLSKGLLLKIV